MKKLIEDVTRKMPHRIDNCYLVKRQDIYIPFCEVEITCLTKEIKEINLIFETILKLIDIGVCTIDEIVEIMGVKYNFLKEVIVDIINQDYVFISGNKLSMTSKGEETLKSRKSVIICKENINQIYVDMITGEIISDKNNIISSIPKNNICLDKIQDISKEFLEKNHEIINKIYLKRQIEFINSAYSIGTGKELYKILDVSREKLFYVKEELFIYKNIDTNDYIFKITGVNNDEYVEVFYSQVRDIVCSGMRNFFETDKNFLRNHYTTHIINDVEREAKEVLLENLYKKNEITDEIINRYIKSRELIDNKEIDLFFLHNNEIECDGIIISCERIQKLFDTNIISAINQIKNKKVYLIYDESEYKIESFLNKHFRDVYKKKKIECLKKKTINYNFICFYPNILIEFVEIIDSVFEHPITMLEGKVNFNMAEIRKKIKPMLKEDNISFKI